MLAAVADRPLARVAPFQHQSAAQSAEADAIKRIMKGAFQHWSRLVVQLPSGLPHVPFKSIGTAKIKVVSKTQLKPSNISRTGLDE